MLESPKRRKTVDEPIMPVSIPDLVLATSIEEVDMTIEA